MTNILDLEKQAEEHRIAENYETAIKYYEKIYKQGYGINLDNKKPNKHPNKKPK